MSTSTAESRVCGRCNSPNSPTMSTATSLLLMKKNKPMRICSKCKTSRPYQWYRNGKNGYQCKKCYMKKYYTTVQKGK